MNIVIHQEVLINFSRFQSRQNWAVREMKIISPSLITCFNL